MNHSESSRKSEIQTRVRGPDTLERLLAAVSAKGLSNQPYLHESIQDGISVVLEVRPTGIKLGAHPVGQPKYRSDTYRGHHARGAITEFSGRSRRNLREMALDLGEYVTPTLMLTATYPGEWRSVAGSGRRTKRHLESLRSWITRWFQKHSVTNWGALWFLEFQERGAPHFHLLLWGDGSADLDLDKMRPALSKAWAKIVKHADLEERAKHLKAGTKLEWLRTHSFAYAVAYASKPHQKQVPDGYSKPGRFWGTWNADIPEPIVFQTQTTFGNLEHLVNQLAPRALAIEQHSPEFASRLRDRTAGVVERGWPTTVRVYGKQAVEVALTTELEREPPP